jgi:hypothetical protein
MSILITNILISELYAVFLGNHSDNSIFIALLIHNRHFLRLGRADLTGLGWVGIGFVVARVRLGRLAVVHYSFMGHFLAAAATSTRE